MGTINWTKDQQQIIDMRGCNILVSAAAGSGKTAVLVERIFKRITDKRDPVNVDQFVVVTFTKLAAAQMKDRLRERIEQALAEDPSNEHLLRQEGRLSLAHISTVHSFCSEIVKRYFHRIGLDPAFRMGTEAETRLLMQDVLDELLEEEYGQFFHWSVIEILGSGAQAGPRSAKVAACPLHSESVSSFWKVPVRWLNRAAR